MLGQGSKVPERKGHVQRNPHGIILVSYCKWILTDYTIHPVTIRGDESSSALVSEWLAGCLYPVMT